MTRRLLALVAALVLSLQALGSASAGYTIASVALPSSAYTNGTVKSFVYSGSHTACGNLYSDVSVRVYYDILNTTKIRITKLVVRYYLKGPTTSKVWGGTAWVRDLNDNQNQWVPPGDPWGDHYRSYKFNSATKGADGYSFVGTYTHYGPVTINGRAASINKRTNMDNPPTCVGDWDYTTANVRW